VTAHSADSLRILYIASLPRSGSTVLGYVLDKLPETIFVGELAYFWRRFAEGELCSCGQPLPDCRFWSAVVAKAFGSLTREQARELNKLEQRAVRRQRVLGLTPLHWSTRWAKRIRIVLDERGRLYSSIREVAHAECIVDSGKEVTFGCILARLNGTSFSTIHLVRDPRGVAFSWQKRVRSDSEPADMPRSPTIKTAARWMSDNLFVQLSLKRLSNAYSRIRYEDLVAYPDRIVGQLSRTTANNTRSNKWVDHHKIENANEHHLVASNPGVRRHLGGDLRLELDDEWRVRLPRGQQWLVTAICGGLMVAYNYPLRRRHQRRRCS
jgi:hypothetical protein